MQPNRSAWIALAAAAAFAFAAPAAAVTFSFASDDNHDGPTFRGNSGGSLPDDLNAAAAFSVDSEVNVDLMVDLNDDAPGGVVTYQAVLEVAASISGFTVGARGAGWVHEWDVAGSLLFRQAGTGQPILGIQFENALMTTFSPALGFLGETAALQVSEGVDPGIRFVTHPLLQGLGVTDVAVSRSEDFAFTFTRLRSSDGPGLPMIDHGVFLRNWISEGSFSAHAQKGAVIEVPDASEE